ncbi:MAG: YbjN domain-containing protein [Pseudomonadota bacterium]
MFKALVIALATLMVAPAAAQTLVDGTNPERISQLIRGFGTAEVSKDNEGDPKITGAIGVARYLVLFFGCTDGANCRDIAFYSTIDNPAVTFEQLNKFNDDNRFGTAYRLDAETVVVKMPVNLFKGVTEESFLDTVDWWRIVLDKFREAAS